MWVPLASGHIAASTAANARALNGPTIATGRHCPEGWTLYPFPGPKLTGDTGSGSAEASYYTWVDQHDTLGLGKDVPLATGNQNELIIALEGRQDDQSLWFRIRWASTPRPWTAASTTRTPAGKAAASGRPPATARRSTSKAARALCRKLVKFQLRPDPLAK